MKISNSAPQHLSNLEVLNHFTQLHAETSHLQSLQRAHKLRSEEVARARYPLKDDQYKEFEAPPEEYWGDDVEENAERRGVPGDLMWIQDQVLKYLCSDYNVTPRQTDHGVAQLADTLQDHGLTKGEVLQIINLAPTEVVELYCIIEEPDTRFHPETAERLDLISQQVTSTLEPYPAEHLAAFLPNQPAIEGEGGAEEGWGEGEYEAAAELEHAHQEAEYVHEEEWGAGHEEGIGEEKENPLE